jgi:Fic family protein
MSLSEIKTRIFEKKKKLAGIVLDPALIYNLGQWLRMELTYTSNALEGNTLTRQETKLVLEDGLSIGGKTVVEILEIKNHGEALSLVQQIAKSKKTKELTEKDILEIHSIILQGINDSQAGKYRGVQVRISGSTTIVPNYMKVDQLMSELFSQIQNFNQKEEDFLDLAIEAHYKLVTIHPFVDGNGRTTRLLLNLILLQNNYPLTFIQKEEQKSYLSALEKAQTGGAKDDYLELMYQAVERSLDLYLKDDPENQNFLTKTYKIGELAKITNQEISTIRYWTQKGLLQIFNKTPSGYALYSAESIAKIKQIIYLQQEKRLNLEEIKDLLK